MGFNFRVWPFGGSTKAKNKECWPSNEAYARPKCFFGSRVLRMQSMLKKGINE